MKNEENEIMTLIKQTIGKMLRQNGAISRGDVVLLEEWVRKGENTTRDGEKEVLDGSNENK